MTRALATLIPVALAVTVGAGCAGAKPRPSKAITQPQQTLQLGMQTWRDGELVAAQQYFANAHAEYRSIDDRQGQLQALLNLGTIAVTLGEAGQADAAVQSAAALLGKDDRLRDRVRLLRAQTHMLSGNLDAARIDLTALLDGTNDDAVLSTARIERTRLAARAGEPVEPWLEQAAAGIKESAPAAVRASLERLHALAAQQRDDTAARIRHLEAALALYRSIAHRPGIAATHGALAEAAQAEGADARVREHYLTALHIQLWIHDRVHAARTLGALAALEDAAGNSERAQEWNQLQLLLGAADADAAPNWREAQRRSNALTSR